MSNDLRCDYPFNQFGDEEQIENDLQFDICFASKFCLFNKTKVDLRADGW